MKKILISFLFFSHSLSFCSTKLHVQFALRPSAAQKAKDKQRLEKVNNEQKKQLELTLQTDAIIHDTWPAIPDQNEKIEIVLHPDNTEISFERKSEKESKKHCESIYATQFHNKNHKGLFMQGRVDLARNPTFIARFNDLRLQAIQKKQDSWKWACCCSQISYFYTIRNGLIVEKD